MFFNSLPFLVFLPVFLVCFFSTGGRLRLGVCLLGSYVFYGWWDVRFLSLIVVSTLIDFYIGGKLAVVENERLRKRLLLLSLVSNLGLLFTFKYFNFFIGSLIEATESVGIELDWPTVNIILPVGISFFTFQTLSYTIDVYRRRLNYEASLLKFAVFVAFFPQLVAGPIVRACDFLPQLSRDSRFTWRNFTIGCSQIVSGFFKKCVIADSLAPYVDVVFASTDTQSSPTVLLGILFYAFQIYCDFAGYSDIAIGLARVMGFHFLENFRRPYFASSFSDFWQRWHISLSSWLRDYLYIPLGGNRMGPRRTHINLMLTMLIGGLWHGAAWTFVGWGFLHGFYLIAQRLLFKIPSLMQIATSPHWPGRFSRFLSGVFVFLAVCVAWVFFRATSFENAIAIFDRLFEFDQFRLSGVQNKIIAAKGFALIIVLVFFEVLASQIRVKARLVISPTFMVVYFCTLLLGIAWLGNFDSAAFIYFQF